MNLILMKQSRVLKTFDSNLERLKETEEKMLILMFSTSQHMERIHWWELGEFLFLLLVKPLS